jgi:transposase
MTKAGWNRSAAFKAPVGATRGENPVAEIAAHHEVHRSEVTTCKTELLQNAASVFGGNVVA